MWTKKKTSRELWTRVAVRADLHYYFKSAIIIIIFIIIITADGNDELTKTEMMMLGLRSLSNYCFILNIQLSIICITCLAELFLICYARLFSKPSISISGKIGVISDVL